MNVEIGAEVVLFPEKEYMNGIFVVVYFSFKREEAVFTFWQNRRTREGVPRLRKNYDNGGDGLFSPLSRGWTPLREGGGGRGGASSAGSTCWCETIRQTRPPHPFSKSSSFDVCEIWSGAMGIATALGGIADDKMMSMDLVCYSTNLVTN